MNDHRITLAARCLRQATVLEHTALSIPNHDPLAFRLRDVAVDLREAAKVLTEDINPKEHFDEE